MTQFFLVLKACSNSVCVLCMRLLNAYFRSIAYHLLFFSQNLLISTKNLSDAAIFIFRCFRSSSLSAFCKIDVLKTSAKFLGKQICRSLFSIKLQTFQPKILKNDSQMFLIFFNEFCKNFKNTFSQDTSRRLLQIFRKLDIQTFNSKQVCSLDQYCRHAIFDEQRRRFQDFHFTVGLLQEQFLA